MIVPMKKVTVLCLEQDKVHSLSVLRGLALIHLSGTAVNAASDDVESLKHRQSEMEKVYAVLQTMPERPGIKAAELAPSEVIEQALKLLEKRAADTKKLESLERDAEKLRPWGNFSVESLSAVRNGGVHVILCETPANVFDARMKSGDHGFPKDAVLSVISRTKTVVCYVLISQKELTGSDGSFEPVNLPEISLADAEKNIAEIKSGLVRIDDELASFRPLAPAVKTVCEAGAEKLEFANARDGMTKNGPLVYLTGYVPVTELERLKESSVQNGWALLIEEPSMDDGAVPTYIRNPGFLRILDPLFDFIGISAGYRENDVSLFFLIFFPVFFGMIIGDAGYGLIFLMTAFVCKWVFRNNEKARLPLNLFILLSIFSLLWGWLNGSWLGIPRNVLPVWMGGLDLLVDPAKSEFARDLTERLGMVNDSMNDVQKEMVYGSLKDKFVQYLCFLLAALHLASARLFKFMDEIRYSWRAAGHLGWGMLIVANFLMAVNLIVFKNTFPEWGYGLYIGGVVLIAATVHGQDLLNLPFALIGSFTDVLSYIRLFAVGLSGAYIAVNFNKMGTMLMNSLPDRLVIVGFVLLALVALAGHILNITLGFLGVLVHAVRLNTLEFSNHMEMQWTGIRFRPFASRTASADPAKTAAEDK